MDNKDFNDGNYDTHFIEKHLDELLDIHSDPHPRTTDMALIGAYIDYTSKLEKIGMNDFVICAKKNEKWKEYGLMKSLQRI